MCKRKKAKQAYWTKNSQWNSTCKMCSGLLAENPHSSRWVCGNAKRNLSQSPLMSATPVMMKKQLRRMGSTLKNLSLDLSLVQGNQDQKCLFNTNPSKPLQSKLIRHYQLKLKLKQRQLRHNWWLKWHLLKHRLLRWCKSRPKLITQMNLPTLNPTWWLRQVQQRPWQPLKI